MQTVSVSKRAVAGLVVALAALFALGAWCYRAREHAIRNDIENDLQAIAQAKAARIADWRAERMGDATVLSENPLFAEGVARWMASRSEADAEPILAQFRSLRDNYRYRDVLLVSTDGQILLGTATPSPLAPGEMLTAMKEAFGTGRSVMTDLHTDPLWNAPHLSIVAPLFRPGTERGEPLAVVALRVDPHDFLYPLIQSWPTASRTGETLLVRKDSDDLLFLNELRHHKAPPLSIRKPLSEKSLPAAMAVRGIQGLVEGVDYRGERVLAVTLRVPDSSWFMVSKQDLNEVLADWRFESVLIAVLVLAAMSAATATAATAWQHRKKIYYRAVATAQEGLAESEERQRLTLMSVGDGVIVTDAQERVTMLNPVAETLTGWIQAEAVGRPLEEVFRIVNEDTRETVESPVARVLREGLIVGLANHTALLTRDGSERPIADSGAPIRNRAGDIVGVVLVFRDQTTQRTAELQLEAALEDARRALQQTTEAREALLKVVEEQKRTEEALAGERRLLRTLIDNLPAFVYVKDTESRFLAANISVARHMGAASADELLGKTDADFYPPDVAAKFRADEETVIASGTAIINRDEPNTNASGSERWVLTTKVPLQGRHGEVVGFVGIGLDITDRKAAEKQMAESLAELRRWQALMLNRSDRSQELKREVNELLLRLGEPVRYPTQTMTDRSPSETA